MPKINGREYKLAKTTPNTIAKLDKVGEQLKEYNEENEKNYLFDEEFRGRLFKQIADIVMDFEGEAPDEAFFADGDLDVGELQNARLNFLANGGMIGM